MSTGSYSLGIRFDKPVIPNDDNSSFKTAIVIGAIGLGGQTIRSEIRSGPYGPELPGGNDEPGHRQISPETHLNAAGPSGYSPNQIILRFQDGVSAQRQTQILSDLGLQLVKSFDFIKAKLVRTQPGADVISKISQLGELTEVRYAQPDNIKKVQVFPNDPQFSQQWHYDNQGQTGGTIDADIDMPEA